MASKLLLALCAGGQSVQNRSYVLQTLLALYQSAFPCQSCLRFLLLVRQNRAQVLHPPRSFTWEHSLSSKSTGTQDQSYSGLSAISEVNASGLWKVQGEPHSALTVSPTNVCQLSSILDYLCWQLWAHSPHLSLMRWDPLCSRNRPKTVLMNLASFSFLLEIQTSLH